MSFKEILLVSVSVSGSASHENIVIVVADCKGRLLQTSVNLSWRLLPVDLEETVIVYHIFKFINIMIFVPYVRT